MGGKYWALVVLAGWASTTSAAPVTNHNTASVAALKQLSLEDLLNVEVTAAGTLVPTTEARSPSAITVITAADIRVTPHRNLLDLLEVYVPGAMVFTHSDGLKLGVRGIVSDRNLKFLLLVNGRQINQHGHSGAAAELANWDLSDIERIEVIRGPGSVTYGPGWWDDPRDFRMGESNPLGPNIANIINGPDSHAINPPGSPAGLGRPLTTANAAGGLLQGTGMNLNNWANHATKAYLDCRFLKQFVFHADARVGPPAENR
jgi:outer membrane receptor protein involved in Fe transport